MHGELVWQTFGYHDLYLKTDVLLPISSKYSVRVCHDSYGLDPCHYFSAPGMAWDAALKMIGINLELFKDEDMYTFIEH